MNISEYYDAHCECDADAQLVRAVFLPWTLDFLVTRDVIEHGGQELALGGVTVEFRLCEGAPTYFELLWLVDSLVGCHVASQTLAPKIDYTGERSERRPFQAPAVRPGGRVRLTAMKSVQDYLEVLNISLERARESFGVLGVAGRQGTGWEAWADEHFTKGTVFAVNVKGTGLTAIRSVPAKLNDKHWQRNMDARAKSRLKLLDF